VRDSIEARLWREVEADRQPLSPRLDPSSAQKVDLPATVHLTPDDPAAPA